MYSKFRALSHTLFPAFVLRCIAGRLYTSALHFSYLISTHMPYMPSGVAAISCVVVWCIAEVLCNRVIIITALSAHMSVV